MKKYWHDPKYKKRHRKRSERSWKKKLRFKEYRKQLNRSKLGLALVQRRTLGRLKSLSHKAKLIAAPIVMCFLENTEEMAVFIEHLAKCEERKRPVYVDMSNVRTIELNAITVLLSVMARFKSSGVKFNGNFPTNRSASQRLRDSGFFHELNQGLRFKRGSYDLSGSGIFTHGQLLVDSKLTSGLIRKASKVVWGEQRRCTGVQRTLVELMHNTNNHASERKGEKHYWISVQHIESEKKAIFSFLDLGVGIFRNLESKKEGDKYFDRARQLISRVFNSRTDILRGIFEGELHRTSTGEPFRGKGLPGIYNTEKDGKLSNLSLITNNVRYDSHNNSYSKLRREFSGTLVTWEINDSNESFKDFS